MRLMAGKKKLKLCVLDAAKSANPKHTNVSESRDAVRGPYISSTTPMNNGPKNEKKLAVTKLENIVKMRDNDNNCPPTASKDDLHAVDGCLIKSRSSVCCNQ